MYFLFIQIAISRFVLFKHNFDVNLDNLLIYLYLSQL